MKKIRILIVVATILYLCSLICCMVMYTRKEQRQNQPYAVDINRIISKMDCNEKMTDLLRLKINDSSQSNTIIELDPREYLNKTVIERMLYLSSEVYDQESIEMFYHARNGYQMQIVPIYGEEDVVGYIRFDYRIKVNHQWVLVFVLIIMTVFYLYIIGILIDVKLRVLKPFHRFHELPYQLARGNYDLMVEENKNRLFGKFLWGMGMLKDTLREQNKKELDLTKEKKMLLLSVSHDIKTPLNAIRLYAKAVEEGVYTTAKEQIQVATKIQEKVAEIDGFVKTIIQSSTTDILSIEVDASGEFYLQAFIDRIEVGYKEKCRLRHLELVIDTVDNKLIRGDMERLYQAAGNLIENALKYGDGHLIQISFSEEEEYQLIHFYNSGTAINENEILHVFESFFRGSNVEGKAGNGLGLYICREIMKKMNGDIYAVGHKEGMEFVLVCPQV